MNLDEMQECIKNELSDLEKICPGVFSSQVVEYTVPFLAAERKMPQTGFYICSLTLKSTIKIKDRPQIHSYEAYEATTRQLDK